MALQHFVEASRSALHRSNPQKRDGSHLSATRPFQLQLSAFRRDSYDDRRAADHVRTKTWQPH